MPGIGETLYPRGLAVPHLPAPVFQRIEDAVRVGAGIGCGAQLRMISAK